MGFKTYQQFLENDIRLECALNFYFNEGQGDHNAQSDTWNLIRVSNCAAQDLGFKVFWNYNASPNSNRDDLRKKYCKEIVLDLSKLGPSHHLKH